MVKTKTKTITVIKIASVVEQLGSLPIVRGGYRGSIINVCHIVPHFLMVWNIISRLQKKLDHLWENCPSNRANQIVDPPIKTWKFYKVQTQACGVSIQIQWTGMLALCAQILSSVSVSGDKAPDSQISKGTLRLGRQDGYLQICSPKLKSEHTAPTFQSIASGLTLHMTMFRCCKIFMF